MRRKTIVLAALGALVTVWIAATVRIMIVPHEDDPGRADALVVLSGTKHARLDRGLELIRQGVAPTLVISGGLDPRQPAVSHQLCRSGRGTARGDGFRVLCFDPSPDSTRGEAREIARLAREHGWKRVLLVTSRFHVTRARMLVERCTDPPVDVDATGVGSPWWSMPVHVAEEWAKFAVAETVARGC